MLANPVKFPLRLKLTAFGVLLALVPTVVVGLGLLDVNVATLETNTREFRLAVADDIAESTETVLDNANQDLVGIQQVLTDSRIDEDVRIDVARALVEANRKLQTVTIHGVEGRYIARISKAEGVNSEDELALEAREAATRRGFWVGEPTIDEGRTAIPLVRPIHADDRQVTGFLSTRVRLADVQRRVETLAASRLSSASRLYLMNARGDTMADSQAMPGQKAPGGGLLASPETVIANGVALSGEVPQRGMLVSARPLDRVPWVAVVEVPLDEAYASITRMRQIIVIVAVSAMLLAVLAAAGLARRLTRPLERLVEFTRTLATRAFDKRVDIQTTDEISLVAAGLNRAAEDLQESEETIAREIAIRSDLGRYLPHELVNSVVRREQDMALGGARREITVLFADVVRFTPLCEEMEPESVVGILNELFTILTEIVFRNGGTVDKFVGDCVMAFWGAPQPTDDHAQRALQAAEDMMQWLEVGNAKWQKEYGVTIQLAVGVNTGEAVIGNIGSNTRMEYTAIGATVNTAARLEALARPHQILTTATTRAAAGSNFDFSHVSTELVATLGDDVSIYEVLL